jgi:hypothetical protein
VPAPSFQLAGDERKHYVRTYLWLPCCKRQLAHVRAGAKSAKRPLRYLTFCAEEAIDVLLLEEEGILSVRESSYADVVFAARSDEYVAETLRTIPDANGFPGDFFETVLFDTEAQADLPVVNSRDTDEAFFTALEGAADTLVGRRELNIAALKDQLAEQFPFDVINLDLCGYTFKKKEDIPGRTILALRRILSWQRKRATHTSPSYDLNEFCFLYTTRIDAKDRLGAAYEKLLDRGIDANIAAFPDVRAALAARFHVDEGSKLRKANRLEYLRLAIPKQLAITLAAEGWEIDPAHGIEGVDLRRSKAGHPYSMLHMAMTLRRKNPLPGAASAKVSRKQNSAYHQTVQRLFSSPVPTVPAQLPTAVSRSLSHLIARGKRQKAKTS